MLSILIHELGHMIGWKVRTRSNCWFITVGSGKNLLKTKRLLLRAFPVGGSFAVTDESIRTTKRQVLLMAIGGPVITLVVTLILFCFQTIMPDETLTTNLYNVRQLLLIVRNYTLFLFSLQSFR